MSAPRSRLSRAAGSVAALVAALAASALVGSGEVAAAPVAGPAGKGVEALAAEPGWAGAWLDAAGTTHVNVQRSSRAATAAVHAGLVRAEVGRSLKDLDAIHRKAEDALVAGGVGPETAVRVDVSRNAVRVGAVPKAVPAATAVLKGLSGVVVETDPTADAVPATAACVSRVNCGAPIRGGVQIVSTWNTSSSCSAGFSASGTDGSRWLMSAGHCAGNNQTGAWLDEPFRHGGEVYGPVRQRHSADVDGVWFDAAVGRSVWLDFLRIRLDNAYWRQLPGGYLYATPSTTVDVKSALAPESLVQGQAICRSSYSPHHPESAANCGTVISYNGPSNEVQIGGAMVACEGDSGGAVYVQVAGGGRRAVGFLSAFYYNAGPAPVCRPSVHSILVSGLTWAYHYMDAYSGTTIRVDTR